MPLQDFFPAVEVAKNEANADLTRLINAVFPGKGAFAKQCCMLSQQCLTL